MSIGIGETLRTAREEQGRTVDEAARATRIRADYLEALEEESFDVIGGDVYAKGFLTTYARWLDLDPEPLVASYRRNVQRGEYDPHALVERPVARPPREGATNWLVWGLVVTLVLLAALAVIGTFGGRNPRPAADPVDDPTSPSEDVTEPTPSATPSPTPSPTPTTVELAVLLEGRSWMRVEIADRVVFEGILESGETREFEAPEQLQLRLGNPGGVRLVLSGRDLGSLGDPGQPVTVVCEPTTCEVVET